MVVRRGRLMLLQLLVKENTSFQVVKIRLSGCGAMMKDSVIMKELDILELSLNL